MPISDNIVEAIEANVCERAWLFADHPDTLSHRDGNLEWFISGPPVPWLNAVIRARFGPGEAAARIDSVCERFRERGAPILWRITPSSTPANLEGLLAQRGFQLRYDEPGMAIDLQRLADQPSPARGLNIQRVCDAESLQTALTTNAQLPDEARDYVAEILLRRGFAETNPYRHYIGTLGGRPVGTAAMLLAHGVAGIYFVSTSPEARRRGIGTAMTVAPLLEAKAMGYGLGVLTASELGLPVYERMGFREYCRFRGFASLPPGE